MKSARAFLFASLTMLTLSAAADATTIPIPELPQPATSFGAVVCEGWLYVYGGNTGKAHEFNRECVKGDFFRLRLPDGTAWEKLTGGTPLLSCSLVTRGGKIIRVGGMSARNEKGGKNDLHSTDEVVCYDPAARRWTALPPLPEPRSSHDSAIMGDTLYVGGGWQLSGDDGEGSAAVWSQTVVALDLSAPEHGWHSVPQPFERRAMAAVAQGGRIWFLGGMDSKNEASHAVDWYEPSSGHWGRGPDLPDGPLAGFGVAGCTVNGRILASPLSGKISALSSDGVQWEEVAKLDAPRFFHRLLPLSDGRLVAVGGSNRQGAVRALELVPLNLAPPAPAAPLDSVAK